MELSQGSRILTIPNFITLLRAIGIPFFLWVFLSLDRPGVAFLILVLGGVSDYADGKLARLLNQESKFGAAFDPVIDRAYIAATVIALTVKSFIPLWVPVLLILRDLWLAFLLALLRKDNLGIFEVSFLGKAATFNLLYALPILLLSKNGGLASIYSALGWSFALWGIALYLLTGANYTMDGFNRLREKKKNVPSSR